MALFLRRGLRLAFACLAEPAAAGRAYNLQFCYDTCKKDTPMSTPVPSLDDHDGKIWLDGQLVDWREAKVHVLTHTLHYGCGVFEGVRAYETASGTAIFRLPEHTRRLFNSAKVLRIQMPFTEEQVNEAQKQVIRANGLKSGYIRPLVWLGSEKLGVSPRGNKVHVMVAAWPH